MGRFTAASQPEGCKGIADESRDATPSFALLDVQGPVIVTYVYQLVDGEVSPSLIAPTASSSSCPCPFQASRPKVIPVWSLLTDVHPFSPLQCLLRANPFSRILAVLSDPIRAHVTEVSLRLCRCPPSSLSSSRNIKRQR